MINVVIPMAGRGSRFISAGYNLPKPLIDVRGLPMIKLVINSLNIKEDHRYIFLIQKDHINTYNFVEILPQNSIIIEVDGLTEGAACTMLLSKNIINCDDELIIANSDQWIDWSSEHFLNFMRRKNADAGILTFQAHEEKWSYAKVENQNKVIEVAEKKPISTNATVGVYFSKKGSDFVKYAERMIDKNIRTNNEFYVCPVFNEYLIDNKNIYIYPVPEMHGIGTPEDLDKFLKIYK